MLNEFFRSVAFRRSLIAMPLLAGLGLPAATIAELPKRELAEKASDNGDKMICKRFAVTGSLVQTYRTCKTKHEWERERQNVRIFNVANSCRLLGEGGSC